MVHRVGEPVMTGLSSDDNAALSRPLGDRRDSCQTAQGGGQAIVGNVTQAAREAAPEKPANSAPSLTHARTPEMPIIGKTERAPVPSRRRRKDGSST